MGTITKALSLLNHFSENNPELGLMDFKGLTGTDKATIHRHLIELLENGFLEQNSISRKYRLGASILRLASVREKTFPVKRIVSQRVKKLSSEIGELVHASVIQQLKMSPLCFHDAGTGGIRVYFNEADMLPIHATASGHAAIAFGPPELSKKIIKTELKKFTNFTITSPTELQAAIEKTRKEGYAYSDQAFEQEICSFAVPFFQNDSYAYGTIAIAIPASRLSDANIQKYANALWHTAEIISNELGGKIPDELRKTWQLAA
jgi:IclR family acetate operon transcriptional repressor